MWAPWKNSMPKPLPTTYTLIMQAFWKQVQKPRTKGSFYCHYIYSRTRTLLMKELPSKGLTHHWFPPCGAMHIDVVATCCVIPERIHTSPTVGICFVRPPSPPLWKFQLSFIHFFKFFGLTESPTPQEIPIHSVGGVWIFSGTAHFHCLTCRVHFSE